MNGRDFCVKYGYDINYTAVSWSKNIGLRPFMKAPNEVDEKAYLKRVRLARKLEHASHQLYYPMMAHFKTASRLARILAKVTDRAPSTWASFISDLFLVREGSDYSIQEMRYEFVIICACIFTMKKMDKDEWVYLD